MKHRFNGHDVPEGYFGMPSRYGYLHWFPDRLPLFLGLCNADKKDMLVTTADLDQAEVLFWDNFDPELAPKILDTVVNAFGDRCQLPFRRMEVIQVAGREWQLKFTDRLLLLNPRQSPPGAAWRVCGDDKKPYLRGSKHGWDSLQVGHFLDFPNHTRDSLRLSYRAWARRRGLVQYVRVQSLANGATRVTRMR